MPILTINEIRIKNLQCNLLNYALILTSDRNNAYGLLNETTTEIIRRQSEYDGSVDFKDWAFAVMRTLCEHKYVRRVIPRMTVGAPATATININDSSVCDGHGTMTVGEFGRRLSGLDATRRMVYELYVKGFNIREITARCRMTVSAVATHVRRAVATLTVRL